MKTIYVGNLPFSASEDQIRQLFEQYGKVQSVKLITDRETGRPRGFGFVEMDGGEADSAISGLNGQQFGDGACASTKRASAAMIVARHAGAPEARAVR